MSGTPSRNCARRLDPGVQGGLSAAQPGRRPAGASRSRLRPIWAEAERLGVPVMFHEGTDGQFPTAGLDRYDNFFMTHTVSHPFEQMLAALSMIAGGVVERFPKLKIAFLESGCGWLPFWLHRMHEHFEKRPHRCHGSRPTDHVLRRQCMISCDPDEATIPAVVDFIGEDYVCWASDYPHWDAIFPRRSGRAAAAHAGAQRGGAAQDPWRKCAPLPEPAGVIEHHRASNRSTDPRLRIHGGGFCEGCGSRPATVSVISSRRSGACNSIWLRSTPPRHVAIAASWAELELERSGNLSKARSTNPAAQGPAEPSPHRDREVQATSPDLTTVLDQAISLAVYWMMTSSRRSHTSNKNRPSGFSTRSASPTRPACRERT